MKDAHKHLMTMGWHYPHPGGLDKNDIDSLIRLVQRVKKEHMKVADVGCWTGFSSIAMAKEIEDCKGFVHSIDWFQGSENTGLIEAAKEANIKQIMEANIRYFEAYNIKITEGDTITISNTFLNEYFDLVFIDSDHRYESVLKDIKAWYPKVKRGGIICGHDCEFIVDSARDRDMFNFSLDNPWNNTDYMAMHIGVIRAVSKEFPDAEIEGQRIWWTVRK